MKALFAALVAGTLAASASATELGKKILLDEPVSGEDSKHAVTLLIDWPVGAAIGDHTHPGDEYAVVLEGSIELIIKGKAPRVYKAGEGYHNAAGVVHATRMVGDIPAKTVATLIVEKGKPLSEKAK